MPINALIVDDSKTACKVLARMLAPLDITADSEYSAEAALDYLTSNKPDIIFMDHNMPGMDGLQAVKIIKSNPVTATIPVMMYTAKEGEVYIGQARALGAVDVLPKEVGPGQLKDAIDALGLFASKPEPSDVEISSKRVVARVSSPDEAAQPDWIKERLARLEAQIASARNQQRQEYAGLEKNLRHLDELYQDQDVALIRHRSQLDNLEKRQRFSWGRAAVAALVLASLASVGWLYQQTQTQTEQLVELQNNFDELNNQQQINIAQSRDNANDINTLDGVINNISTLSSSVGEALVAVDEQGESIGRLLSPSADGSQWTLLTDSGYLVQVGTDSIGGESPAQLYFSEPQCRGDIYARLLPGQVVSADGELWFTSADSLPQLRNIASVLGDPVTTDSEASIGDSSGSQSGCQSYQGEPLMLSLLLRNQVDITGVSNQSAGPYRLEQRRVGETGALVR